MSAREPPLHIERATAYAHPAMARFDAEEVDEIRTIVREERPKTKPRRVLRWIALVLAILLVALVVLTYLATQGLEPA